MTGLPGLWRMKTLARHRSPSVAFKRQVAQEDLSGQTRHGLAKRHDLSRNRVRVWVQKYETGARDADAAAADTIRPTRRASPPSSGASAGRLSNSSVSKGRCEAHRCREAGLHP